MKNGKFLKKFDLEHSVAGGPLKIDLGNHIDFDNVVLSGDGGDYLIHAEPVPGEKRYKFSVYKKKE